MSFQHKMLCLWLVCFSCGVVLSNCQVTLVTRDVVDSFRVGKDGCTNDSSVCQSHSAICHSDGLCMCEGGMPNFRSPILIFDGISVEEGDSYGCMETNLILLDLDNSACVFGPLQVIPYSHDEPATQFPAKNVHNCSLKSTSVISSKFPDNASETELHWLNESYVDFIFTNNALNFTWKLSVPRLQGTLITFNLKCMETDESKMVHTTSRCLRAKIRGTWIKQKKVVSTTVKAHSLHTGPGSISSTSPSSLVTTDTSSTRVSMVNSSTSFCNCDKNSNTTASQKVVYAFLAISFALNIFLGIVVRFLWKKRNEDKKLKMKGAGNIDRQGRKSTEDAPYDEVIVVKGGPNNRAHDNWIVPPTESSNNDEAGFSTGGYDEPSNYEPLKRNPLQDESDNHNYQSLVKPQEKK